MYDATNSLRCATSVHPRIPVHLIRLVHRPHPPSKSRRAFNTSTTHKNTSFTATVECAIPSPSFFARLITSSSCSSFSFLVWQLLFTPELNHRGKFGEAVNAVCCKNPLYATSS